MKIKNAFAGVCGTDLHLYFDPMVFGGNLPQILGHEFSGSVVEKGQDVTDFNVGDRATGFPIQYCGECGACAKRAYFACTRQHMLGLSSSGGGMSEFTVVDAAKLHKLPDNVDLRMGALVEAMAVAGHAVNRSGVVAVQSALVAGAGPVGIGLWFALRARRVERVLVSEPNESRRKALADLGATVVDPVKGDLAAAAAAAELSGGAGLDVAFDAAGVGPAIQSAVMSLAPGGRVVVVALHEQHMEYQPTLLVMREAEIVGAIGYMPEDFDSVIRAMADGKCDTTGWVEEFEIGDLADVIKALHEGRGTKVLTKSSA
ncbi:alcohol dehydrogenase catalytic domain-containing protein [Streptomyces sp. NPDC057199]|uniref:alcohol dehydrogenase catalytic domain-containing protein n=1 Tax=Streptomyces sp. NPDC057199 TaxID=3346047 RepID=UPI00363722EB